MLYPFKMNSATEWSVLKVKGSEYFKEDTETTKNNKWLKCEIGYAAGKGSWLSAFSN